MQPIPQDIIGDIVEQIHGDKQTLMICSLVSRQFEPSCRKHLFSYIQLNRSSTICRFNILLSQNPSLAALVRHLNIHANTPLFDSEIYLPRILGMLTCLRRLELGYGFPTMNWEHLSRKLRSALLELCQSPSLSTLDIGYIVGLPPALLKITHGRKLGIQYMSIHDYHTPVMELDFTGLEALDICIEAPHFRTKNRSLDQYTGTTNSRQLSIRTCPENRGLVLEIVHNVMEMASKTLKHVKWHGYQKWNRDLCAITYC